MSRMSTPIRPRASTSVTNFDPLGFDPSTLSDDHLNIVLQKIYTLSLKQRLEITHNNNTSSRLYFIGKYKTFENYRRRTQKKVLEMIRYVGGESNLDEDTEEECGVSYLLRSIANEFPNSFRLAAVGTIIPKLSAIQSSALIEYCNITDSTAYERMNKFFIRIFGIGLLSPKRDLHVLNQNSPEPIFGILPVTDNNNVEKKELMIPWVSTDIGDLIQKEFERNMTWNEQTVSPELFQLRRNNPEQPEQYTFGYSTCAGENRIYCIVSSDHGQKHAQFDFSLLLAPSSARRNAKSADHGILNAPFFTAECPTDKIEVTKIGADKINEAIELLESCQLVGVYDNNGGCKTEFIPSNAKEIQMVGKRLTFKIDTNPTIQYICLDEFLCDEDEYIIDFIFKGATVLIVADYKEAFTLQGRDGMSSSKCLHCTATASNWKPGDVRCESSKISLEMLNSIKKDIGCKTKPLINLPPDRYITPLLHLLLGLINDIWKKGILPTAIDLDGGSKEEVELRTTKTANVCERIKEQRIKMAPIVKIVNSKKSRLNYWLKKDQLTLTQKQLETLKKHQDSLAASNKILAPMKAVLEKYLRELRSIKQKIENIVEKRVNNKNSTDTKLKDELTKRGIHLELYHGGTLTGNNCKKLCEKAHDFITVACNICVEQYEQNALNDTVPAKSVSSVSELRTTFKRFEDAIRIADVAFTNLNLIAPTKDELKKTEESVRRLGQVWEKVVGVTHTTKVHSLLEHACDCQKRFGGLGDKTEQGIEQRHQVQKQMCYRLKRFGGNFESRMKKQLEYEWRQRHPAVEQLIFSMNRSVRKRKYNELTLAEENAEKKFAIQNGERKVFMRRLCIELDAEMPDALSADVKINEDCVDAPRDEGMTSIVKEME